MVEKDAHSRARQLLKHKRRSSWDLSNHVFSLTADAGLLLVSAASLPGAGGGVPESHQQRNHSVDTAEAPHPCRGRSVHFHRGEQQGAAKASPAGPVPPGEPFEV